MMQNNKDIFESLFKRDFSDPGNNEFLKNITASHPYFSPAQFFLLQQISPFANATGDKEENTETFKKQVAKTNLLFNNPHWLNFLLKQTNTKDLANQALRVDKNSLLQPEQILESSQDLPDNTDARDEQEMEKEIEPMHIELKMPEERVNMDEAMLFEPMHIVDYFASQGIKLTDEVQTADKLGKQLKSFTEWLKTMKKVHVESEAAATDQSDTIIQTLAEKSNSGDDVLTVSMADVLAKQGKKDKALEIYQKLSLLNPAKSAYFAAKIETLKGI